MANVEFVLALEQLELVPLRRGWWVAQTQTVARHVGVARPWGRIIEQLPKEALMIGGGGAA